MNPKEIAVTSIELDATHVPVYLFALDTQHSFRDMMKSQIEGSAEVKAIPRELLEKILASSKVVDQIKSEHIGIMVVKDTKANTVTTYIAHKCDIDGKQNHNLLFRIGERTDSSEIELQVLESKLNAARMLNAEDWHGKRLWHLELESDTLADMKEKVGDKWEALAKLFNVVEVTTPATTEKSREEQLSEIEQKYGKDAREELEKKTVKKN